MVDDESIADFEDEMTTIRLIDWSDGSGASNVIGVCQDSGSIYEQGDDNEWYKTKLIWDHENGKPKGF